MKQDEEAHDFQRLSRREKRILRYVVEQFVATGRPVGSRVLSKLEGEHLSPASIRNSMADLEESGYLQQPHVSAGRIPTDEGFRFYVDYLMESPSLPKEEQDEIVSLLLYHRGRIDSILESASRLLSRYSHYVGIVTAPRMESTVFRHIEFIRQGAGRVLVVFISRAGMVHNKLIEFSEDLPQEELDMISRWVVDRFRGKTLREVRERVGALLLEERVRYDKLMAQSLRFSRASLGDGFGGSEVFVDGTSNILGDPDFSDVVQARNLFKAIEEKAILLKLLDRCLKDGRVHLSIGSETELRGIEGCSLVGTAYYFPDGSRGALAVLGPRRMPYQRTIFLVDYISKQIGRMAG